MSIQFHWAIIIIMTWKSKKKSIYFFKFVNIKKNNPFYNLNKKFNTKHINWGYIVRTVHIYAIIINKLQL